ncbi:MAG: YkgJ family cysteine cluster protein [Cyclobacteriaceae bacterium]
MSIKRKVRSVERLFDHLDQEITEFNSHAKLHCQEGCGKCCTKPDIDASPLEFLPWSYHLFLNGQAEIVLNKLKKQSDPICHIYKPLSIIDNSNGNCGAYKYRGLICRLFGYGASKDKLGQLRLATCAIIREGQRSKVDTANKAITQGLEVPIFSDYYMKLSQIDFHLGNIIVPINQALIMAIEEVLQYYAYRPLPNGFDNAA